ncbi:ATP-binding cassette domain-containing protein [Phytoactinopolyspora halotolerans]|uniref:Sugar ABC transporter ATP-binding protein n=1 Tax=Phytoactinopolyspora halotolerans TaxID=1981512 RepID=A0A6L9S3B3_9ACTN|nr:ATP-binding cassette domain-containing protein [Phytoactinopolyspora halotolerans]NED99061.1 sugar ABC transporter ATP-binding protein [Phytoactinopolyspora halotolerans]
MSEATADPAAESTGSALLRLEGISKAFGAVQALEDVDFEVHPGEVVALVGDNGAGKSTLVKTVAGIHGPDLGRIVFDEREVTIKGPRDAVELGIETVYQDLALCDNLDVVANLFLGRERLNAVRGMDEIAMEERAWEVLRSLRVTTISNVRLPVAAMSGGQRQSVAVARAVMWDARVVLLDEPTAALGVAQTQEVLALVRRLREHGIGVVVISHNLADVFDVADRIIVLRLGRRVATFDAATADPDRVVGAITGAKTEREVDQ